MTTPRGNLLDHTPAEVEATPFARDYGLTLMEAGDGPGDPRLHGLRRRSYRPRALLEFIEFELLVNAEGQAEVAGLWIDRRLIADKATLPAATTVYTSFLVDAIGAVAPRDTEALGNFLAVSFDVLKQFEDLLAAFPFVPRDGVGAANEVLLGRRLDASQNLRAGTSTLVVRNDPTGRLYVGIATASAAFNLAAMLFHAPTTFTRAGERSGVLGWHAPEVEATPFGRRFELELDRAAPPQGRIARRYFGFPRIPRSARVEVMMEPTRGLAGVMLRIEQDWMEQSDRNFFGALELLAAFVAEGIGQTPDARTRVEVGDLFSVKPGDADLFKTLHAALPFIAKGKTGDGTGVFLGEAESAVAFLDENRCGLVVHENADGWLDCMFYASDLADAIGSPAIPLPSNG